MLLIGIKMSFTKKPTNPITTNPIAVRTATFVNSARNNAKSKPSKAKYTNRARYHEEARYGTFAIWFVTTLNETNAILSEVSERIDDGINSIHGFALLCFRWSQISISQLFFLFIFVVLSSEEAMKETSQSFWWPITRRGRITGGRNCHVSLPYRFSIGSPSF